MRGLKMSLIILIYLVLEMVYCSAQGQISLSPARHSPPDCESYSKHGRLKRSPKEGTNKEAAEKNGKVKIPVAVIADEPQEANSTGNEVDVDLEEPNEKADLTTSAAEAIAVKEEKKAEDDVKKSDEVEEEVVEKVEKEKEVEKDEGEDKAEDIEEKEDDKDSPKAKESKPLPAIKARLGPSRKKTSPEQERNKDKPTTPAKYHNDFNSYQPNYQYNPYSYSYNPSPYNPYSYNPSNYNPYSYNPYSQRYYNNNNQYSTNWQYPQHNPFQYSQNPWRNSQNQWPTQYSQFNQYPEYSQEYPSYNYNSLNPYGLRDYSSEYQHQFLTKYGGSARSPYFTYEHLQRKKRKAHNPWKKHGKKHH